MTDYFERPRSRVPGVDAQRRTAEALRQQASPSGVQKRGVAARADGAVEDAADAGSRANAAQATADSKNRTVHAFAPPTDVEGFADGDRWEVLSADGATIAIHRFSGGAWVAGAIDGAALERVNAASITEGYLDVAQRVAQNAITIDLLAASVGADLVLSSNESIVALAGRATDLEGTVQEQGRYLVLDGDGLTLGVPSAEGGDVGAQLHMDVDEISMLQGGEAVSQWSGQRMRVTRMEVAVINIGKHQFEQDGASGTIIRAL